MSLENDECKLQDFASCFALSNLLRAARLCTSGSLWKGQTQQFDFRRLTECRALQLELLNGSYKMRQTKEFTINERGKTRHVNGLHFRDRVVQRCFCDNGFSELILHSIVAGTGAALRGRGTSHAYKSVRYFAEEASYSSWIVQYDFSNYFGNINQDILLNNLGLLVDTSYMGLIEEIVHSKETGLGLGSPVNQLCATFYPTALDKAAMSVSGATGYYRYMDDGIIFCESRASAMNVFDCVHSESSKLGLKINSKKTFINKISSPFVFCKMRFTKLSNGSVKMNVRKRQTHRSIRHVRAVCRKSESSDLNIDVFPIVGSCVEYINRGDSDLTHLIRHEYPAICKVINR